MIIKLILIFLFLGGLCAGMYWQYIKRLMGFLYLNGLNKERDKMKTNGFFTFLDVFLSIVNLLWYCFSVGYF